ncbi:MAG: amidohydrolase family protein [Clostridia bacterium]|nr:amidohydrolase family protein [Clostridia bacterium]
MITSSNYVLTNVTIADGSGNPSVPDRWMHVKNGKIACIGDMSTPDYDRDADIFDFSGKYIMPGMVEAHVHMAGGRGDGTWGDTEILCEPDIVRAMRSVYEAQKLLKYGFTTVRDISVNSLYLKRVFNDNTFPGPKVIACGRGLARSGGHCDSPQFDLDYVKKHHFWAVIADGEDECRRAVRSQLREGADEIKFWATGGGNWGTDRITDTHYTFNEMKAICEEAHMIKGTLVCAHCETEETIRMAIEAGVDTIEHGEELTEELAEMMAEKGIVLVPTLFLIANWYDILADWYVDGEVPVLMRPDPFLQRDVGIKLNEEDGVIYKKRVLDSFNMAREKGVTIALGSDTVYEPAVEFGEMSLEEFKQLVDAGMTVPEAVKAATANGAVACAMERRVGMIKEGLEADYLVFDQDPNSSVDVIGSHDNLKEVVLNGKTVVENGNLIW